MVFPSVRLFLYNLSQEATLERAKLAMQQGMRRLNRAYQQSKSWHMLYLVLFALGAFIFVLFFSRLIGIVRFIFCIPSVIFGYCKHKST